MKILILILSLLIISCGEPSSELQREQTARTIANREIELQFNCEVGFLQDFKRISDSIYLVSGTATNNETEINYRCFVLLHSDTTGVCKSVLLDN